ncbi:MAG: hypothetical protein M5R36_22510 [Deltaproteobacteria bacterium]|nr:hypothetical protein [Deltaproteobacteria bacterium]
MNGDAGAHRLKSATSVWLAAIAVLGTLAFHGYLRADWLYDDHVLIVESSWYERPLAFGDLTSDLGKPLTGRKIGYWRPGELLLFRAAHAVFAKDPFGWRALTLSLHLAAAFALFFWARRILGDERSAGLAALLFAVHPAHGEIIAVANQMNSAAEGLLVFLALYFFTRGSLTAGAGACAAAVALRESGVMIPFAMFWLALTDKGRRSEHRRAAVASFAVVICYLAARTAVVGLSVQSASSPILCLPALAFPSRSRHAPLFCRCRLFYRSVTDRRTAGR